MSTSSHYPDVRVSTPNSMLVQNILRNMCFDAAQITVCWKRTWVWSHTTCKITTLQLLKLLTKELTQRSANQQSSRKPIGKCATDGTFQMKMMEIT